MRKDLLISAAVALVIAVLSGLGVGSGGLLVIWLTMVEGVSPETARGMNLLFFVFSASAALAFHLRKRKLDLRLVITLSLFAVIGTLWGTHIGNLIDPTHLRKLFGCMLVASGSYTLLQGISPRKSPRKTIVKNTHNY